MRKFYTSYDIELAFELRKQEGMWPEYLDRVRVFGDEIEITVTDEAVMENPENLYRQLHDWFGERIDMTNRVFIMDTLPGRKKVSKITVDFVEKARPNYPIPLFNSFYRAEDIEYPPMFKEGPSVFAFHSYKGGVGRTLSALSFCRALGKRKKNGTPLRLLIVDADYEAPGLTWLARKQGSFEDFSLLDALSLVHEEEKWEEDALELAVSKIQEELLRLPAEGAYVEHYFLPAYREEKQLMSMPVMPKQLIQFRGREWIVVDFLHLLGKKLGVDAVVVDLRAGISEFSAPVLFDPRVQKILVSTTSLQAVRGSKVVLSEIMQRMPDDHNYPLPFVFTSMVTQDGKGKLDEIEEEILEIITPVREPNLNNLEQFLEKNTRTKRLEFAQELVHLEDLEQIGKKLGGTDLEKVIDKTVEESFNYLFEEVVKVKKEERDAVLDNVVQLCTDLLGKNFEKDLPFLRTTPIRRLALKFSSTLPVAVVMGRMGAGKTFNFLNIIKRGSWKRYLQDVVPLKGSESDALLIPLFFSDELSEGNQKLVNDCFTGTKAELSSQVEFQMSTVIEQMESLIARDASDQEWKQFWLTIIAQAVGCSSEKECSLSDLNRFLGKKVLFVIDGLEKFFCDAMTNEVKQRAIRSLYYDVVSQMRDLPDSNMGLIVFVRNDIVEQSLKEMYYNLEKAYETYELKWSAEEALRLALWIAHTAGYRKSDFEGAGIELLQMETIEEILRAFWGHRIEDDTRHTTTQLIIYMLTDAFDQLSARDIVRFLQIAAKLSREGDIEDEGVYLQKLPVSESGVCCVVEKFMDFERENPFLKELFDKLRGTPIKALFEDLGKEELNLSAVELKYLQMLGVVSVVKGVYRMRPNFAVGLYLGVHVFASFDEQKQ